MKEAKKQYLMCERKWVYFLLMLSAGAWGSYTYLLRGNVFCNAQTGNVVLMGMALGAGEWSRALYYLIPISAYLGGSFVSELVPVPVKEHLGIRWDTLLVAIELAGVLILGLIPDSAPVQISQVMINFLASMQYNTFRQMEGEPVATTFATNHIRQVGVGLAMELRHRHDTDKCWRKGLLDHIEMLFIFLGGAAAGTVFCGILQGRAIWMTLIPLGIVFAALLHADLTQERNRMEEKPSGH